MIAQFETRGRRWAGLLLPGLVWLAVAVMWITADQWNLSWWIVVLLVLWTAPALWDVWRDARAQIEIWPGRVVWSGALTSGDRSDIEHVRLSRRFDGTLRITLMHPGGGHTRLPPDITAPIDALEAALLDAGVSAERHPFSLW